MRRAQGSITRHGDGWRVFATIHDGEGEPRRVSRVVHGTRKEAEKVLAELLAQDYRAASKTFESVCRMYLQHCEKRAADGDLEPSTLAGYRSNIDAHIIPRLGRHDADALRPHHVRRFLDALPANRSACFRTLRQVMRWAVRLELMEANPCDKVQGPKGRPPAVKPGDVYTADEAAGILARPMSANLRRALLIALGCGLRRGEICGLLWSDYDGERLDVSKAYGKERPKTANGVRLVSVPAFVREELDGCRGESDAQIVTLTPDALTRAWSRFLAKNPDVRPLPFKNWRHTSLSLMVQNGADLLSVSRRAGHASIYITDRFYTRLNQENDDRLGELMGNIFDVSRKRDS